MVVVVCIVVVVVCNIVVVVCAGFVAVCCSVVAAPSWMMLSLIYPLPGELKEVDGCVTVPVCV